MAGSFISVEGQANVTRAFNRLLKQSSDLSPALGSIGEYLIESTQQRFIDQESPDGQAWEPLASETIKRKTRKDRILTESGTLADTLNYQINGDELMFGSNMEYAATHQFGRDEANIPARMFLGLSDDDEEEILAILSDHLTGR